MLYREIARKASKLHKKYNINNYPIEIHLIEQIIIDYKISIKHIKKLRQSCIIEAELLTPHLHKCTNSSYRTDIVHELSHIILHSSNHFYEYKLINDKKESEADAFSAYFLMPPGHFEKYLLFGYQDYYLAEKYGVTEDLVKKRKRYISYDLKKLTEVNVCV